MSRIKIQKSEVFKISNLSITAKNIILQAAQNLPLQGKQSPADELLYYQARELYDPAVKLRANVSSATGTAQIEQFGNFAGYDKVIVTDDLTCPIDENSVLFVDKLPEYSEDGTPLYDYVVKRVAKSLNAIAYAIQKVNVS